MVLVSRNKLIIGLVFLLSLPVLAQAGRQEDSKYQWKGTGNVVFTRCVGMQRGPDCLTHQDRKKAAARVRARSGHRLPHAPAQTTPQTNNPG